MVARDGTKLGMLAALTFGAACGSAHLGDGGTTGGTGGRPDGLGGAKTTSTSKTAQAVTAGTVGSGGGPTCDPPAVAGSFWAQSALRFGDVDPTSMCNYRGDVLLVVNTADV
jgi:hypothetical protein